MAAAQANALESPPAFSVPNDLGFRLLERWQFNLVQVIKAAR